MKCVLVTLVVCALFESTWHSYAPPRQPSYSPPPRKCRQVPKDDCKQVPRTSQETVYEEECSVSYEQECNTRYEDKCHPVTDEKSPTNDDPFQSKLLVFMSKSCPDGRYDVNWREEILRQILPSDFFSIWTNYDLLTSDLKDANVDIIIPTPIIRYPTIDIAKCNTRSLANVPKPQKFPLFGCSDDPNFYIKSRNMYQPEGEFYKNIFPFGAKYGYLTNQGVVPVPEEPVFGYVWDGTDEDSRWVLCAVHPPDQRSKVARKWKGLREKG